MKSCPVCGSELKPLFSSLQCFNDNCGKEPETLGHWRADYYRAVNESASQFADAWRRLCERWNASIWGKQ